MVPIRSGEGLYYIDVNSTSSSNQITWPWLMFCDIVRMFSAFLVLASLESSDVESDHSHLYSTTLNSLCCHGFSKLPSSWWCLLFFPILYSVICIALWVLRVRKVMMQAKQTNKKANNIPSTCHLYITEPYCSLRNCSSMQEVVFFIKSFIRVSWKHAYSVQDMTFCE